MSTPEDKLQESFESYDVCYQKHPSAFAYKTEVEVSVDGEMIRGTFAYGGFGPFTFDIVDDNRNILTFVKNKVKIRIIKENKDLNYNRRF